MKNYISHITLILTFVLAQQVLAQDAIYPDVTGTEETTASGEYSTIHLNAGAHFIIDTGHDIVFHNTITADNNGNSGITIEVRAGATLTVLAEDFINLELNNFTFIVNGTLNIQNGNFKNNFHVEIGEEGLFYVEDELTIGNGTTEVEVAGCFYVGGTFESDDKVTIIGNGHAVTPNGIQHGDLTDEVIIVVGDFVWNGLKSEDVLNPENWWRYNGTEFVRSSLLPTDTNNVIIGGNHCFRSSPVLDGVLTVKGIYILSGNSFTLLADAKLSLHGDFMNNGVFSSFNSSVLFIGLEDQRLYGNTETTFSTLSILKSNDLILEQNINVVDSISMNQGYIYLNDQTIDLGVTGRIHGEDDLSYIHCQCEDGVIKAQIVISGSTEINPGNLGLLIKPDATYPWGVTQIERRHFTVADIFEGRPSINRVYYAMPSTNNGSLNTTLKLTFLTHEYAALTAYDIDQLAFFRNADPTTNGWQNEWELEGGEVENLAVNAITINNWNQFSGLTGGISFDTPLPIEMLEFFANCNESVILNWETASESNTMQFEIHNSIDGVQWNIIDTIIAQGDSDKSTYYSWEAKQADFLQIAYFRLKLIDFDGNFQYYGPVSINCNYLVNEILVFPIPIQQEATMVMHWESKNTKSEVVITDLTGRTFEQTRMELKTGTNTKLLDFSTLKPGLYKLTSLVENQIVGHAKVVKQ